MTLYFYRSEIFDDLVTISYMFVLDPFSDAVVQIYLDNAGDLELVAKNIESSDLNFSRYGNTFFEVVFTGGRTQPGTIKPDEGERHLYSVIECEAKRQAILPSSLELFEDNERKKLAIFTALAFSQKLSGLPPETVFQPPLKDNLVVKGIVLSFITDFSKEYLVGNSLEDLISILKPGKMEENLLDFFPSAKRSAEGFSEHFAKVGLVPLVEYNEKKVFEVKTWAKLLNSFCASGKLELELIRHHTLLVRKGTNPKGRQTFVKALEPFVKWLEEAEEEE
ncbi:Detected protein of confused Function [Hibiscus syriacus]|uniref:Detected protein of confused Function n=1 Tax=Hibiscus syriacus TaxID=106335 RepID=A0A6A2ZJY1_HIBSY|nr:Detected protein of confused Function [Hibiscus syriacus]